mmetsp:Transcript_8118/g.23975  ORF Transcript_8118/g.23975 Transcript_8118/m.23975 type:complete len:845 (-) Transcript_8118:953-3487(-)
MADSSSSYAIFHEMDVDDSHAVPLEQCISTLLATVPHPVNVSEETLRQRLETFAKGAADGKITFEVFLEMRHAMGNPVVQPTSNDGDPAFMDMGDSLLQGSLAHEQSVEVGTAYELVKDAEWGSGKKNPGEELAELRRTQSPPKVAPVPGRSAASPGAFKRRFEMEKREKEKLKTKMTKMLGERDETIEKHKRNIVELEGTLRQKNDFIQVLLDNKGTDLAARCAKLEKENGEKDMALLALRKEGGSLRFSRLSSAGRLSSIGRHESLASMGEDDPDTLFLELVAENNELVAENKELRQDLNLANSLNKDLKEELAKLRKERDEMDKVKYDLERTRDRATDARETMEVRIAEFRDTVKELRVDNKQLEAKVMELTRDLGAAKTESESNKREWEDAQARNLQLNNENDRLGDEAAQHDLERSRAEAKVRELENRLDRAASEMEKVDTQIGVLDADLQIKAVALNAAETEMTRLRGELASKSVAAEAHEHHMKEMGLRATENAMGPDVAAQLVEQQRLLDELGEALADTRAQLADARQTSLLHEQEVMNQRNLNASSLAHANELTALEVRSVQQLHQQATSELARVLGDCKIKDEQIRTMQAQIDRSLLGSTQKDEELGRLQVVNATLTARCDAAEGTASTLRRSATEDSSPVRRSIYTDDKFESERRRANDLEEALQAANDEIAILKGYIQKQADLLIQHDADNDYDTHAADAKERLTALVNRVTTLVTEGEGHNAGVNVAKAQHLSHDFGEYVGTWPVIVQGDIGDVSSGRSRWLSVYSNAVIICQLDKTPDLVWTFPDITRFGIDGEYVMIEASGTSGGLYTLHCAGASEAIIFAIDNQSEQH